MEVTTNFLRIPDDNSILYIGFVTSVLGYADPDASMNIHYINDELKISITPSIPEFRQDIINNMVYVHRLLKLKPEFSKSTLVEKGVHYSVSF